jgi:hypothetical protein
VLTTLVQSKRTTHSGNRHISDLPASSIASFVSKVRPVVMCPQIELRCLQHQRAGTASKELACFPKTHTQQLGELRTHGYALFRR